MAGKIKEVSLKATEDRVDETQLRMLFESMIDEIDEHLNLFGPLEQRTLKTIARHQEIFSRRFSLDFLNRFDFNLDQSYHVTVNCLSRETSLGDYSFNGFKLTFTLTPNTSKNPVPLRICGCVMTPDSSSVWEYVFHDFVLGIFQGMKLRLPYTPDLFHAYLAQGCHESLVQIRSEINGAMVAALNKGDARELFSQAVRFRRDYKELAVKIEEYGEVNRKLQSQVCLLNNAIHRAVKEIEETKSMTKSQTLEGIRERLEAALNQEAAEKAE